MANINVMSEKLINTSGAKLNMQRHGNRIAIAENINKKLGKGALTLEKRAALATCLENTRQICEATQSSMLPSKTFFLDMVASVIPNTIAPEIVSVQAMESKAGMISYLRFVYGSNKGATTEGQMFNNSLYHGESDEFYSAAEIKGEIVAEGQKHSMYAPVVAGTVRVDGEVAADADVFADLATGELKKGLEGKSIDYRYNNEDITVAGAKGVPAGVNVPQINLELAQLPVFAQSRKLAAYWGFDAAYDLKKQ
jgi:hypothetical protein